MKELIRRIACSICKFLGGEQEIKEPPNLEYKGELDIFELSSILIDKFPDVPIYLSDMTYKTCRVDDVKRFLTWDKTNEVKFENELHDCDDFAYRLMGNITVKPWSAIPFGIIWTSSHALNIFVDADGKIWIVEPQLDKVQAELENWQAGTEVRFIVI